MRTIYIFCSFLMFAISAKAQITITSSSMPVSGDTIRYSIAIPISTVVNANLAIKGDSASWDLSKLVSNRQDMYSYKSSWLTPYGFYFFNKIGLKTADSLGTSMFTFKNIYSFYTRSSTVFKTEGLGYSFQNIPLAATYKDEDEIYKFPLDYHDSDVSTFYFEFELPAGNLFRFVQGGTRTNYVDGWGSVKTPYKTYPNVLRMKTTVDEVDTLITQFGSLPFPRRQVIYRWLSADEHIPVVEITGIEVGSTFIAGQIIYRDRFRSNPLAILTTAERSFFISPNPADGNIYLNKVPGEIAGPVEIFDHSGKSIYKAIYNRYSGIDLRSFSAGVYYVHAPGHSPIKFLKN